MIKLRTVLSHVCVSLVAFLIASSLAATSFAEAGGAIDRVPAITSTQGAGLVPVSHLAEGSGSAATLPDAAIAAAEGSGSGSAGAGSAAPLPTIENLGASISEASGLWRSGLMASALIIIGYVVLLLLSLKVPWFQSGKRAVYIGAALGFLGTIIQSAGAEHTTPNLQMTLTAALTALALVLNPTKAAEIAERKAVGLPPSGAL